MWIFCLGQELTAAYVGELDSARFSGVRVLILPAACLVAKN
jgi:hypothetical protein